MESAPAILNEEAQALNWMGELTLLRITGERTGGRYTLAEVFVTPAGLVPRHIHHREDEAFYLLDGEVTFEIGDKIIEAKAGSFVFGPRDVPHRYTVKTPTARLLMLFSPAGFEGFIRETSSPAESLIPPDPSAAEVDFDQIVVCANEYGSEVLD
jgi:quercetin dioxygenase-like cupin family protein